MSSTCKVASKVAPKVISLFGNNKETMDRKSSEATFFPTPLGIARFVFGGRKFCAVLGGWKFCAGLRDRKFCAVLGSRKFCAYSKAGISAP